MADETQTEQAPTTGEAPATFEAWFESVPDPIKGLVTSHMAKQLKAAAKGAEEGSALRQQLEQMVAQAEAAEARASFFEDAARPEIGCTNARLAYLAAETDGLIDSRGRVNWEQMKTKYAELFRQPIPRGNAGEGAGTAPPQAGGMNAYIRRAAGRTT